MGERLLARVEATTRDQVLLRVGTQLYEAPSSRPHVPGEELELVVTRLQPLTLQVQARGEGAALRQTLQEALRALLPQAGSLRSAATQLIALTAAPSTEQLPPPVARALEALREAFPRAETLCDPAGLKRALAQSGLFFEAELGHSATTQRPPPPDLKAALLRLATRIRAELPRAQEADDAGRIKALLDLLQSSEGSLDRLGRLQLHAAEPQPRTDLLFELPVWHHGKPEPMQLRIEDEKEGDGDGREDTPAGHSVRLGFELEGLGEFQASVHLAGERVRVQWWAAQAATGELIADHLAQLEARLRELGLETVQCETRTSRPAPPDDLPRPRQGLLNEEA